MRNAEVAVVGAQITLERSKSNCPAIIQSEMKLFQIQDLKIAIVPGEPYAITGSDKQANLGEPCFVFGYCNDILVYVIPPEEELMKNCDVILAPLTSEAPEIITSSLVDLSNGISKIISKQKRKKYATDKY